jgi:hypothetical protein
MPLILSIWTIWPQAAAAASARGYQKLASSAADDDDDASHIAIPMISDGVVPSFNMSVPGAEGSIPHVDCCEQMCCTLACCGAFQQWDLPWTAAQVSVCQ